MKLNLKSLDLLNWLNQNKYILLILIPTIFILQRCYFPIMSNPELKSEVLPSRDPFTDVVLKEFPLGSNEADFIAELVEKSFKIWPSESFGNYKKYNGGASYVIYPGLPHPCSYEWRILWKSEDGKIVDLFTLYGSTCV